MKKAIKILITVVIIIAVLIVAFIVYLNGIPIKHSGLKYADEYRNSDSGDCVYFTEDDFGDFKSETYDVKEIKGAFHSVGSMYTITYSDKQYKAQLDTINKLEFLDKDYMQTSQDDPEGYSIVPSIIPAEKVEKNGWLVRIINNDQDNNYPKQIAMIATNDDENTICYMYFTDMDLDIISDKAGQGELVKFIEKSFSFTF